MALVRQVCAHIYMLDFGRLVFEGSPEEMLASAVVRAAYLGSEGVGRDHRRQWCRRAGRRGSGTKVLELQRTSRPAYGDTVVLRDM